MGREELCRIGGESGQALAIDESNVKHNKLDLGRVEGDWIQTTLVLNH